MGHFKFYAIEDNANTISLVVETGVYILIAYQFSYNIPCVKPLVALISGSDGYSDPHFNIARLHDLEDFTIDISLVSPGTFKMKIVLNYYKIDHIRMTLLRIYSRV